MTGSQTGTTTQMNISESKPLCTPCHFRADGVFCSEGLLYYSQPSFDEHHPGDHRERFEHGDTVQIAVFTPVTVEGEPVTCSACDGKGHILTADGKQLLVFLETFA